MNVAIFNTFYHRKNLLNFFFLKLILRRRNAWSEEKSCQAFPLHFFVFLSACMMLLRALVLPYDVVAEVKFMYSPSSLLARDLTSL